MSSQTGENPDKNANKPTLSILSNKRLSEIKACLIKHYGDEKIDEVIEEICEIMRFNPDYRKGLYNPAHKERAAKWRERKAAEYGVSVSMVANGKYKTLPKKEVTATLQT